MSISIGSLLFYAAGGIASAAGGWLFHRFFKLNRRVASLDVRLDELEEK